MARHKLMHHEFTMGKTLGKAINVGSAIVPFLSQITEKDIRAINLQTGSVDIPFMDQVKNTVNIISGRITGFNPFQDAYQAPATRNPAGIFNGWTFLGIGLTVLGHVFKGTGLVPHAAQMKSYGKKIMFSGAVGGFFDAGDPTQTAQKKSGINYRTIRTPEQMAGQISTMPTFQSAGFLTPATMDLGR